MAVARRLPNSRKLRSTRHNVDENLSSGDKARSKIGSSEIASLLGVVALIVITSRVFWLRSRIFSDSHAIVMNKAKHISDTKDIMVETMEKYENCSISFVPATPRKQGEWRKPLWMPSYPASGSASPSKKGDIVKQIVDSLTGLKQGTKNYHMSVKGGRLKRCYGISETAACSQGHPFVPIGPEDQTKNFQSSVVFIIRNVATAFPASHTDKHIAYHGGKGQAPEHQWRKIRDEYLEGNIKTWKDMIRWWKTAEYYNVELYVPFEWLLSPSRGPPLVQKLAEVFQKAGFDVAPPSDIPCIWYRAAKKEWARQEKLLEYVPRYTKAQKELLLKELKAMQKEIAEDPVLSEILRQYIYEIQENTQVDQEAKDLAMPK